ncbi:MAG: DUF2802 domain-containing protein [Azovibrio sp.]|nr:DUF2802 domain-containing protein [Azovibrio sp.]
MQLSWGGLSLGWREGLLALIIAVIVYMLWLLARMRRIGRPGKAVPSQPQEPQVRAEPAAPIAAADAAEAEPFWSGDGADSVRLAQEAFMAGVERELEQLREEMDALRGALAGLREDVAALSQTFEQEIHARRAAQQASPLYSDAMQMALLGHDALTIAERCGIARAEAELVVALVRNKERTRP